MYLFKNGKEYPIVKCVVLKIPKFDITMILSTIWSQKIKLNIHFHEIKQTLSARF